MFEAKYFNWDKTPKKFYQYLKWAGLPLSILLSIALFFWLLADMSFVMLLFSLAAIVSYVISLVGVRKRRWFGVQFYFAAQISEILFNRAFSALCYQLMIHSLSALLFPVLILQLVVLVLTASYFRKRRPLFPPSPMRQYDGLYDEPYIATEAGTAKSKPQHEKPSAPAEVKPTRGKKRNRRSRPAS